MAVFKPLTLFDLIKSHGIYSPKNSASWFMNNVRNNARGLGPMKVLGDNIHRQTDKPPIGKMIFFTYDPKTKDKLPYYDTFPLVLPFSINDTSFYGINFHYLHPRVRLGLVNKLMEYASNDRLDDRAKLEVSWKLLNNASKFPEIRPAIKQYLYSHVKSRMAEIPPADMPIAVFLPVERFKKKENEFVWAQATRVK